jgi:hypothetical protein
MNMYQLALFAHLCGVVIMFAGMGGIVFGVVALWQARRVEQARLLAALIRASGNLAAGAIVLLGIGGFYMAITVWGERATWIIVATISFVLLAPFGLLIDRRLHGLEKLAAASAPDSPLTGALVQRARDPLVASGLSVYLATLIGIVFLMTTKPATVAQSVVAMVAAVAAGALLSLPFWRLRARRTAAPRNA